MKPRIIVVSEDSDDTFQWVSDGWYSAQHHHSKKAHDLMQKAETAIKEGKDVPDSIRRLENAGFEIGRNVHFLNQHRSTHGIQNKGQDCS